MVSVHLCRCSFSPCMSPFFEPFVWDSTVLPLSTSVGAVRKSEQMNENESWQKGPQSSLKDAQGWL